MYMASKIDAAKKSSIEKLPPELVLQTFEYLSRKELSRLKSVCRAFSELAQDQLLLVRLNKRDPYEINIFLPASKLYPSTVRVMNANVVVRHQVGGIPSFPSLQEIAVIFRRQFNIPEASTKVLPVLENADKKES